MKICSLRCVHYEVAEAAPSGEAIIGLTYPVLGSQPTLLRIGAGLQCVMSLLVTSDTQDQILYRTRPSGLMYQNPGASWAHPRIVPPLGYTPPLPGRSVAENQADEAAAAGWSLSGVLP